MTPEEKAKLDNLYELVKENNDMLHGMRRRARWTVAWRVFYWVLIIRISFGAFYFIQPYVDMVRGLTGGSNSNQSQGTVQTLRELLE